MKTAYFKLVHLLVLMAFGLSVVGCDNAIFSSQGSGNNKVTDGDGGDDVVTEDIEDLIFIDDSFERDDIFADLANEVIYGWRGFVLDGATPSFSFTVPSGAGARIPPVGEFGPAADGERFLLMNGDNDTDLETVHVISQSYDLSQYNTVLLSFRYMTFNLNDATDTAPERLELQVCRGTLNECGANDDALNAAGMTSNNWVTVFTNDQAINDDNFNGKNHVAGDWQQALAVIDLRNPELVGDGSTFVFRFRAAMTDGLNQGECKEVCKYVCKHDHKCNKHKKPKCENYNGHDCGKHKGFDHSKHHGYDRQTATADNNHGDKDHKDCKDKHHKDHKEKCKKHKDCKDKHCKDKHKCKKHKCKKHKNCKKECKQECTPGDGTIKDGVAIDDVLGRATARPIEDIF